MTRLKYLFSASFSGAWGSEEGQSDIDLPCVRVADFDRSSARCRPDIPTVRSYRTAEATPRLLARGDILLESSGGGSTQPVGFPVLWDRSLEALCSNFVTVLRPAKGHDPRWVAFLLEAMYRTGQQEPFISQTTGIQNLNRAAYLGLTIPVPALGDQSRIADFLDRETARIDELLQQRKHQADLLEELLLSAASSLVGARIDGEPSWGSPGDWISSDFRGQTVQLKRLATVQTGLTLGKQYAGELEELPYLRVANVQAGQIDLSDVTTIKVPREVAERCELRAGDVLMTEGGDFDKLGRGAVWDGSLSPCLHQNHVFAVRPNRDRLLPEYLELAMGSAYGRAYFTSTSTQSTNLASTNLSKVREFPVPLPSLDTQQRIVTEHRRQVGSIGELIGTLNRGADLLAEYRRSLITEAVTGQLDPARMSESQSEELLAEVVS